MKGFRFGLSVAVLGMVLWAATPGQAQDIAPLQDRVDRLERALNDLKIFVHRGKPPAEQPLAVRPSASGDNSAEATGVNARLVALEAEIRALTNRVEEIDFSVRRMNDRMDKLVADVDFRLTAIERNMGAPAPAAAAAPATGNTGDSRSGTGRLGTVSRQAVERVPGSNATAAPTTGTRTAAIAEAPQAALEGEPEQRYKVAFGLLQSKQYGAAEASFQRFIQDHPQHQLAGNAQYWLGETYYVQGDYERAATAFLDGYKTYRNNPKSPDNLLKLGMTLAILKQNNDACAVFAELKNRYPNAPGRISRRARQESGKAGC